MYAIENVIRNAEKKDSKDRLSILIVNDGNDRYIESMAKKLSHDFYLVNEITGGSRQWKSKVRPENLFLINDLYQIPSRHIDAIIVFNRTNEYEKADFASKNFCVPLIVIDTVTSQHKIHIPFGASVNIENESHILNRNIDTCVALNDTILHSWINNNSSLCVKINHLPNNIKRDQNSNLVLLDPELDRNYLVSMGVNFQNEIYTNDPEKACVYLNMWQSVTPLMIDCMHNGIPVATIANNEFEDIIKKECCIVINDLTLFNNPNNVINLLQLQKLQNITDNAKSYFEYDEQDFKNKWNNIINHVCNKIFMGVR